MGFFVRKRRHGENKIKSLCNRFYGRTVERQLDLLVLSAIGRSYFGYSPPFPDFIRFEDDVFFWFIVG